MMVKVLVYAYATGVFSSRKIERRLHASIEPEHGQKYRIFNHSSQQTWVNEQRVPEYGLLLNDGDEIRLGKTRLRFHVKSR